MLHEETVKAETLALIRKLSADPILNDFVLVGGTALALQTGHRKSIDIDLFTARSFDPKLLAGHIESLHKAENINVSGNALFSKIEGVKTDMIAHQYDWLNPVQERDGVRMASLEDIGAMKLHAIIGSGYRLKDFFDIYYLLEQRDLSALTGAYEAKYKNMNAAMAKNALLYHKEIDFSADLGLMNPAVRWSDVKSRLREAVIEPKKMFEAKRVFEVGQGPSTDLSKNADNDQSRRFGKGRRK